MLLETTLQGKKIIFEVIPLYNDKEERILFFIQHIGGASMIAEKRNPGGEWVQLRGGEFAFNFNRCVYEAIDNTNFMALMQEAIPFDSFSG